MKMFDIYEKLAYGNLNKESLGYVNKPDNIFTDAYEKFTTKDFPRLKEAEKEIQEVMDFRENAQSTKCWDNYKSFMIQCDEDIRKTFRLLLRIIPKKGIIVANGDDENVLNVLESSYSQKITFGFGEDCDFRAVNLNSNVNGTTFEIEDKKRIYSSKKQNVSHIAKACKMSKMTFGCHFPLLQFGVILL